MITQERALLRRRDRKGREVLPQRHSQVCVRLVRPEKVQNENPLLSANQLWLKSPACAEIVSVRNMPYRQHRLSHLSTDKNAQRFYSCTFQEKIGTADGCESRMAQASVWQRLHRSTSSSSQRTKLALRLHECLGITRRFRMHAFSRLKKIQRPALQIL